MSRRVFALIQIIAVVLLALPEVASAQSYDVERRFERAVTGRVAFDALHAVERLREEGTLRPDVLACLEVFGHEARVADPASSLGEARWRLHEAAMSRFGDVPFFWLGHSLGGHIAMLHAGLAPSVHGVALFASGSPYYKAWTGRERAAMAGGALLVRLISGALGHFPGKQLRFGERESAGWARDWYRVHRSGSYSYPGFDGDALLRRMEAPVLSATVFDDRLAPAESTALLVERSSTSDVTRVTWNPGHGVGHNRWPRRLTEVAATEFDDWVSRVLKAE